MIAYCGLICTDCPAYIATQENDNSKRAKTAKSWSKEFGVEIKPEDINCDGCISNGGRLFNHCKVCEIRQCGQEKHIDNCGHCSGFACDKLDFVFNAVPNAKKILQQINDSL